MFLFPLKIDSYGRELVVEELTDASAVFIIIFFFYMLYLLFLYPPCGRNGDVFYSDILGIIRRLA